MACEKCHVVYCAKETFVRCQHHKRDTETGHYSRIVALVENGPAGYETMKEAQDRQARRYAEDAGG